MLWAKISYFMDWEKYVSKLKIKFVCLRTYNYFF